MYMIKVITIMLLIILVALIGNYSYTTEIRCDEISCKRTKCFSDGQCGAYCKCFKVDPSKFWGQCLINY